MPSINTAKSYKRDVFTRVIDIDGLEYNNSYKSGENVTDYVTRGENLSNWKALIKSGQDATTSLYGVRHRVPLWQEHIYTLTDHKIYPQHANFGQGYPEFPGFGTPSLLPTTKAATLATQDFLKSFNQVTQKWSGGVFLGELRETAKFLGNPVKGMYGLTTEFFHDVRKIRRLWERRKAYAQALSELWLSYSFGMKPLISDANDAALALRALASGRTFDVIRIRGEGTDQVVDFSAGTNPSYIGLNNVLSSRLEQITTCNHRFVAGWKSGGEIAPAMTFGLNLGEILPTVWELIPYSFLLDYFSNMGELLGSLKLRFVDFAYMNSTSRTIVERRQDAFTAPTYFENFRVASNGGSARTVAIAVNRGKSSQDDFRHGFYVEAPGFPSLKWLNIAALAKVIHGSRP